MKLLSMRHNSFMASSSCMISGIRKRNVACSAAHVVFVIASLMASMIVSSASADDHLEVVWADSITSSMTSEGPVRVLNWNVHLRQGDAELFCDHVRLYQNKNEVTLDNNVKYVDPEKSLQADKIVYDDANRIAHAFGRVVVVDSLHTLTANEVIYHQKTQTIIAENNVVLTDHENEIKLTGDNAEYRSNEKYAKVTGTPVLIKTDSTGIEELRIFGLVMEVLDGGSRAIVTDSVKIIHKDGYATCQKAEFFKDKEYAHLQQQPIMVQRYDRVSGDDVELYFKKRELSQAIISKNALVKSPVDTLDPTGMMNRVKGEKITLDLEKRKLVRVLVEGQATSYYHVVEKFQYKGLNEVIGDKIIMYLKNNELQQILFESNPGTSDGKYYPPNFSTPQE
jgi:lipopolysaccharide export system protein LptA